MNINLIVAVDSKTYGIGYKGSIPWKNKDDMKWFKKITTGDGNNAVVMGRKTYESIGKPLPNRVNIVLSTAINDISGCIVAKTFEDAITIAKQLKVDSLFVMGGGSLYKYVLENNLVDIMYIDYIHNDTEYEYDTYFDKNFYNKDINWKTSNILEYTYNINGLDTHIYYNVRTENTVDACYLELMNEIIKNGKTKYTRAGETLSVFGEMMTFDLRKGLPVLTTKKVYSKGCIHELLWILHGDTNIKYLVDNNTHIWDDDAYRYYIQKFEPTASIEERTSEEDFLTYVKEQNTRTYLDENNNPVTYTYGDLGPVYGKQWVNWNGINQVAELINKLKTNPDDRRLMISAWNVGEIKDMALPPCHYLSQWYVTQMTHYERCVEYAKRTNTEIDNDLSTDFLNEQNIPTQYLSCMWMQRSVDTCLGLPYDLLSYSILTNLIAHVCNMVPYELKCSLGDTHIYKNQLDGAIKQVQRNPYKFEYPTISLNKDIKDINDFTYNDIKINNYNSYSTIKYPLSVGL